MGQLSQKWAVINKMWTVVCKLCTACCCAWQPQTDPSGRPFWHFRNNSLGTHFKWMHDSNTEGNASIVRSYVTSAWMHQLPWIEGCCRNVLPPTPNSGSQGWAYSSGHWARDWVAPRAGHGSIMAPTLLGVWEEVGVSRGKQNQHRKSLPTPNGCDAHWGCHSNHCLATSPWWRWELHNHWKINKIQQMLLTWPWYKAAKVHFYLLGPLLKATARTVYACGSIW